MKKKRRRTLGSPHDDHARRLSAYVDEAGSAASRAHKAVGNGKCDEAIKAYGDARELIGQAKSHYLSLESRAGTTIEKAHKRLRGHQHTVEQVMPRLRRCAR